MKSPIIEKRLFIEIFMRGLFRRVSESKRSVRPGKRFKEMSTTPGAMVEQAQAELLGSNKGGDAIERREWSKKGGKLAVCRNSLQTPSGSGASGWQAYSVDSMETQRQVARLILALCQIAVCERVRVRLGDHRSKGGLLGCKAKERGKAKQLGRGRSNTHSQRGAQRGGGGWGGGPTAHRSRIERRKRKKSQEIVTVRERGSAREGARGRQLFTISELAKASVSRWKTMS